MGASITDSFSRNQHVQDSWGKENTEQQQQQQGQKRAVFDSPEAKKTLGYLTDFSAPTSGFTDEAAANYRRMAGNEGAMNPYTEALIADENKMADRRFGNRLAQTRAGAYRGGTGANMYAQDKLAQDFTNEQSRDNNAIRTQAFEAAQGRGQTERLAGSAGLSALRESDISAALQNKGIAAQILALLRGEDVEGTAAQQSVNEKRGKVSGTQSGHTFTGQASYGASGGV